jgi:hypothetical protein
MMSRRDEALIDLLGISIADLADLFGRKRQTIHAGLLKTKGSAENYLTTMHLIALVQYARRRDHPQFQAILDFIQTNYLHNDSGANAKDLIFPAWGGIRQLLRACATANQIIVLFNWNKAQLFEDGIFLTALNELNAVRRGELDLLVPNRVWTDYLYQTDISHANNLKITRGNVAHVPFILAGSRQACRGFAVCKLSLEEIDSSDAQALWTESILSGIDEREMKRPFRR